MTDAATSEGPYPLGTLVRIDGTFLNEAGDEDDPTTVTLTIEKPNGETDVFVWPDDLEHPVLTRTGLGVFSELYLPTASGLHAWSMEGDGHIQDTLEGSFRVFDHLAGGLIRRALCSLDDVLGFAPGYEDDDATNRKLTELINEQSREAYAFTGKEFVAIEATQPATRLFDIDRVIYEERELEIQLASSASLAVVLKDLNDVVQHTVPAASIKLLPRVREEWEPFWTMWLPLAVAEPAALRPGLVAWVTGTWGFPGGAPSDVRQAVARMVIESYLGTVSENGTSFASAVNGGDNNFDRDASLDAAIKTLRRYRDWSIG